MDGIYGLQIKIRPFWFSIHPRLAGHTAAGCDILQLTCIPSKPFNRTELTSIPVPNQLVKCITTAPNGYFTSVYVQVWNVPRPCVPSTKANDAAERDISKTNLSPSPSVSTGVFGGLRLPHGPCLKNEG